MPLLLIHGFGITYTIWNDLAPLLRAHFRLIMVELPGMGESPPAEHGTPYYEACAESIEELRHALGINQWAILAYSMGTRAAEAYMQRFSEAVTSVIFVCPLQLHAWRHSALHAACWLDQKRPAFAAWVLSDWRLHALVRVLCFNGHRHASVPEWVREIAQHPIESLTRPVYELSRRGRAPFVMPSVPTLFIWGHRDAIAAPPRRLRTHDHVIRANHSAPLLAAAPIARCTITFLTEGATICLPAAPGVRPALAPDRGADASRRMSALQPTRAVAR